MKTTRLLQLFFLVVSSALVSCSSSDDGNGGQASSITLSVDNNDINLGQSITFTVLDEGNANITSQATIYFSGMQISENPYTPTQPGTFVVNAKVGNTTSNNISVNISSLVVSSNKSSVFPGEVITLNALGNQGNNLTSEATFYVNGEEITGNTYTAETRGVDIITATHETLQSNEKSILVGYPSKALIEDFTGTWCGWCPRVSYGIELVEEATEEVVVAAIHRYSSAIDPFNFPAGSLESFIGLGGYPTAMLNRTTEWATPEPSYVGQVVNLTQNISPAALGVTSELNGNTLSIDVSTDILDNSLSEVKLVVYVLEDGLIYEQTNYTEYYGGADYITDFVHENVLRQVPTGLFGEELTSSDLDAETNLYNKSYSFELDSNIADSSNIHLAVFVTDADGNVLNVIGSQIGESIAIEE
ncbi:Omp28-related outer membrane protein [Mangrovimonas sp. YM274]|uniref:Omp28-related outer membrane protein n=1 Tax=Mangrovimonas sp. YM274 TaxID=3070660 RepID=UPI0027DD0915|nr:Omp28-related outer membrane protein [Mangrovimonas sp. YM274]WMI68404.1 Omp28-related outer membrane protein [Mangrovimonas sp. YM274]